MTMVDHQLNSETSLASVHSTWACELGLWYLLELQKKMTLDLQGETLKQESEALPEPILSHLIVNSFVLA